MKELRGRGGAAVAASRVDCLALLRDVAGYPSWHPDVVRAVEVLSPGTEAEPTVARATLRASLGPLNQDFQFLIRISHDPPNAVRLERLPNEPSDPERLSLIWRVSGDGELAHELAVELYALLDLPRLLLLPGAGDLVARGFLTAARRALEPDPGS